jgi:hypothetical protein
MNAQEQAEVFPRGRLAAVVVRAIWALGVLLVGAIGVFAAVYLARFGRDLLMGVDTARLAWAGGAAILAAAAWALVISNRGPFRTHPLLVGLLAIVITRLLDVALVGAPLVSDFKHYSDLGVQIAHQGPTFASVPTGYPMALAVIYTFFGENPVNAELLNCAIAVLTGAMIFDITRRVWDGRAATWTLWLFALAPSQILMTGVLATEAPYGLLLIAAIWLSVRLTTRPLLAAACIGCLLAASMYVRATTPILLPAFMLIPFVSPAAKLRPAAIWAGLMVLVFLICMLPVVAWNEQTNGKLSITPSYYGGWSLLVGTDSAKGGQYNPALFALVDAAPGTSGFDTKAGELAVRRLEAKPIQFVALAVRKFPRMWAPEDYAVSWTVGVSHPANRDESLTLLVLAQRISPSWDWPCSACGGCDEPCRARPL